MHTHSRKGEWELLILDGQSGKILIADVDGDGKLEIISGSSWYRSATFESGSIPDGVPVGGVGPAIGDVDGDSLPEVVGAVDNPGSQHERTLYWSKPGENLSEPWTKHIIFPKRMSHPHDQLIVDIDGDGQSEVVAVGVYGPAGLYIYKPGEDITEEWRQHIVQQGTRADGTVAADLDGDGIAEIVSGPFLYKAPPGGPFTGPWIQIPLAVSFRELCKAALLDITGNGRPDVIIAESEYPDCRVSWFENRMTEDPDNPWIEHPLDAPYDFIHALAAWHGPNGEAKIFFGEMEKGGWQNPYNYDARLMLLTSTDNGKNWQSECIHKGVGAFQAVASDVDGDGEVEIISQGGVTDGCEGIHIWRKRDKSSFPIRYRHRFIDRTKSHTGTDMLTVDVDGDGLSDIVCGAWWYRNPSWERFDIPGVYQVHNSYDVDGDGREELIVSRESPTPLFDSHYPPGLGSDFCWLKPVDPSNGKWEEHPIGTGPKGWVHGSVIAPVLPGGKVALLVCYHSARSAEMFEVPDDPRESPWPKSVLTDLHHSEDIIC